MSGTADTDCRGHNAAQLAAYIHAAAGDICREEKGEQAMLAGDMVSALGGIFNMIRNKKSPETAPMDDDAAPKDGPTAVWTRTDGCVIVPEDGTGDEPAE